MSFKDAALLGACAAAGALAGRSLEDAPSNLVHVARVNGLAVLTTYCAGKVWQPEGKMGTLVAAGVTGCASGMTNVSLKNKNERNDVRSCALTWLAGTMGAWFVTKYVMVDLAN